MTWLYYLSFSILCQRLIAFQMKPACPANWLPHYSILSCSPSLLVLIRMLTHDCAIRCTHLYPWKIATCLFCEMPQFSRNLLQNRWISGIANPDRSCRSIGSRCMIIADLDYSHACACVGLQYSAIYLRRDWVVGVSALSAHMRVGVAAITL